MSKVYNPLVYSGFDEVGSAVAGSGYATIQDEGTNLAAETKLNFVGMDITASDDAGNTRTNVKTGFSRSFFLMGA